MIDPVAQASAAAPAFPEGPDSPAPDPEHPDNIVPYLLEMIQVEERRADFLMKVIIPLGVALVYETDFNHLLERILLSVMSMSRADGGALYLRGSDDTLRVAIFRRESLDVAMGGTTGRPTPFSAIDLTDLAGDAARAVASGQSTCRAAGDDERVVHAEGPEAFDREMNYRVVSCLAIPLRDNAGRVIGVIELVNARRPDEEQPVPFESTIQRAVEALSLLAAAALESYLRQQKLKEQVQQLKVEVDNAKKTRQVAAIVGSDYFKALNSRARDLRAAGDAASGESVSPTEPI